MLDFSKWETYFSVRKTREQFPTLKVCIGTDVIVLLLTSLRLNTAIKNEREESEEESFRRNTIPRRLTRNEGLTRLFESDDEAND